ncbi:hypothetical protein [Paenibacillus polymyxa]|uniref:hypothetical protein n=1 Tax=Paenibacillus polymyxa TaxID=1406 RepID=UPI002ED060FB|nr:hypothetical protein [Paenibacillus polymyxa]
MALMTSNQARQMADNLLIDRMKMDGHEKYFAKLELYERERFKQGHMTEEARIVYLIHCAYQDALDEGISYDCGHLEKTIEVALTIHRSKMTGKVALDAIIDTVGGLPITVIKALVKIFQIWYK